jgi:hypothetical protein
MSSFKSTTPDRSANIKPERSRTVPGPSPAQLLRTGSRLVVEGHLSGSAVDEFAVISSNANHVSLWSKRLAATREIKNVKGNSG